MALVQQVLEIVKKRNPNEPEFIQAVTEVLDSIRPVVERNKKYRDGKVLERLVEPERMILAPDCGMKYLPREIAFGKLKAMVEGAKIVRAELNGR